MQYGTTVTLRAITGGTGYDPTTSQNVTTNTDTSYKAAVLPFDKGTTEFNGELIRADDMYCIMEGAATPRPKDLVVINGLEYYVQSVKATDPSQALPVVNELLIRR